MNTTKMVVKPDMLFGKRGKSGLVSASAASILPESLPALQEFLYLQLCRLYHQWHLRSRMFPHAVS